MNIDTQSTVLKSLNSMFGHPEGYIADDVQVIDMFTAMIEKATRGLRADREMLMIREAVGVVNPEKDLGVDLVAIIINCFRRDSIAYQALLDAINSAPEPESPPEPEPAPEPEPGTKMNAQRDLDEALADLSAMGPPDVFDKRANVLWRVRKAWMALGHG